ncbi:hypothetical protein [Kitasatospora sp. NBC_00315]|uniref:hypothetical protein n=1 Tax=Kitasatospora sp. NBC_00315 TaxID=2975963 RepID=UPI003245E849
MRNGLVQLGAWAAATGAAVALSWFGVHAVLTGAAFEQPKALPLPSPAAAASSTGPAESSAPATDSAETSAVPTPSASATVGSATQRASAPGSAPTSPQARRSPPAATTVHSYLVPGGRVALDIRPTSAELVSATPDPGWQMQVWHGDQWMRIDFSKDGEANSVFVTWNGHEPDVQTVVR